MSNKDENEREDSERNTSGRNRQQTDPSLATAIESSLQAGLRSLSEGLGNLVGEDAKRSSRGPPRSRPPTQRTQANQKQRTDSSERKRARKSESTECLIDTRLDDGEFVVVADLPGATKDDLTAGIDPRPNELVIKKTGTTVGRVELPWTSSEMRKAWFKNGILEVYTIKRHRTVRELYSIEDWLLTQLYILVHSSTNILTEASQLPHSTSLHLTGSLVEG